ncbi:MAG: efflux RND transporter periplasmic adaptor subunit [Planctomycetota bacterium]|nr:efflux RND transporter periplasmic adaptor subunit [Planctomycetota bacterium]
MTNVDLSTLRIDDAPALSPKRPIGPKLLVGAVLALTVTVAATFLWPLLSPPRAIRLAAVQAVTADAKVAASMATTEAVGWAEADPFLHIVRPLIRGRIETLDVLEGARVTKDETIVATLASAELQAARDRAVAAVAEAEAGVARADADAELARARLRQNAENALRVADARTRVAAATTKVATATEDVRQARAAASGAAAALRAQERLQEAGQSYPVALERARAEADAAAAAVDSKQRALDGARDERKTQTDKLALCEQLAQDPVDLRGAVAQAAASSRKAEATLQKARTDLAIAERELGWASVRSPVSGVVMRLEAQPGDLVGQGAAGVVALYDPKKLRARIDVPLDSLAGIFEGQRVEVTSEAIGDVVVAGVVQRLQHETDMLKNTLQVKIGLIDPPALLRPETLCRARFLAPSAKDGAPAARAVAAFRVPKAAVRGGAVFVYDPASQRVRAVAVQVDGEDGPDVIVRGALSPTQRVAIDAVDDGEAVREAAR